MRRTNLFIHPNESCSVYNFSVLSRSIWGKTAWLFVSHVVGGACYDSASSSALNSAVRALDRAHLAHGANRGVIILPAVSARRVRETPEWSASVCARSRTKWLPIRCVRATPSFWLHQPPLLSSGQEARWKRRKQVWNAFLSAQDGFESIINYLFLEC